MKFRKMIISMGLIAGVVGAAPAFAAEQTKAATPATAPRMGTKPEQFLMTKITVSDLVKSYDFYTKIIGLKLVSSPDIEMSKAPKASDPEKDFVEIGLNYSGSIEDPMFMLIKRRGKTPAPEQADLVWLGFKVPSTNDIMKRASDAGIEPSRPFSGEGGVGFIKDPDGYNIELVEVPSFETE